MPLLTAEPNERQRRRLRAAARALRIDPGQFQVAEQDKANAMAARERRHAAIMSMHGIWKDDPTKPHDGIKYQREVRDEWP